MVPAICVEELHDMPDLEELSRVLDAVWGASGMLDASLLRAFEHAGGYVAGASMGGRLVGGCVGFMTRAAQPTLHSHITGVLAEARALGVGRALKRHQRRWALDRGIEAVHWTFDPLVRRNARFNLAGLGAAVVEYHANFYGTMGDAINGGDESDRVLAEWRLRSPRAEAAAAGRLPEPDVAELRRAGATVSLLAAPDGAPIAGEVAGDVVLCQVPEDAVALRRADPALGRAWRLALRGTLGRALESGYEANAMSRDGWYVLTRRDPH